MGDNFDFSGWATRNDILCADGRTIRHNAFKDCDGLTVPLVWNHQHGGSENVLGHALLENRDNGVYVYGSFNDTTEGARAKEQVRHGDITSLSIYANHLRQNGGDVVHGIIREVSLVLAGANPGARIDTVLCHGEDDEYEEEAEISLGSECSISMAHADDKEEIKEEKKEDSAVAEKEPKTEEKTDKTVKDVIDSMTEEQKTVMYAMVGQALEEAGKSDKSKDEDSEGGNETMKHNAFDAVSNDEQDALMHSALETIINDGKRYGSMKESFLAHADEYGITNIDYLFPDAKNITDQPGFIKRNPDAWVDEVMNGVHHTPFSRVKMMFADLTEDEARAKGYTKGKLKKEEVFSLLKRTVDPTTIYKKQKMDRDDVIDITDFDVIAWLKGEMRMMLDEEIARAILFGDGRSASSDDKIDATKIIPICSDAALYTIEYNPATSGAKDIINAAVKSQDTYEGSGNTRMFVANSTVTDMLLLEDTNQHRLYKDVNELAMACSVSKIVKVPASIIPTGVYAVIVDLKDYNVGADKGGAVNMFDDFDIDYNQQKYLIETRCSGALVKPYSAIVLKAGSAAAEG